MKILTKIAKILFIGFILLLVVPPTCVWLWKRAGLPVPMYQPSTRDNKQLFLIADEYFLIPQNYIWLHKSALKVDGVNMHTLYPDMLPYTDKTKALFDEIGRKNGQMSISLQVAINPNIVATVLSNMKGDWKKGDYQKLDTRLEGFDVYRHVSGKQRGDDHLIGKLDNGQNFFFYCSRSMPTMVPSPSCDTTIMLTPKIKIHYIFARDLLPQWQQINQHVITLIERFRQEGAQYAQQQKLSSGEH
jgi:hypothetical protein